MKRLIKGGLIVPDEWERLSNEDLDAVVLQPDGPLQILPLAHYRQHAETLRVQHPRIGIWLGPDDEPEAIAPYLNDIRLIAIHFPVFTDGRGYSTARLLRSRFGFTGELRAVGDILRDQLYFLHRCGFDAFSLRGDQDLLAALDAFGDYAWSPFSPSSPDTERGPVESTPH